MNNNQVLGFLTRLLDQRYYTSREEYISDYNRFQQLVATPTFVSQLIAIMAAEDTRQFSYYLTLYIVKSIQNGLENHMRSAKYNQFKIENLYNVVIMTAKLTSIHSLYVFIKKIMQCMFTCISVYYLANIALQSVHYALQYFAYDTNISNICTTLNHSSLEFKVTFYTIISAISFRKSINLMKNDEFEYFYSNVMMPSCVQLLYTIGLSELYDFSYLLVIQYCLYAFMHAFNASVKSLQVVYIDRVYELIICLYQRIPNGGLAPEQQKYLAAIQNDILRVLLNIIKLYNRCRSFTKEPLNYYYCEYFAQKIFQQEFYFLLDYLQNTASEDTLTILIHILSHNMLVFQNDSSLASYDYLLSQIDSFVTSYLGRYFEKYVYQDDLYPATGYQGIYFSGDFNVELYQMIYRAADDNLGQSIVLFYKYFYKIYIYDYEKTERFIQGELYNSSYSQSPTSAYTSIVKVGSCISSIYDVRQVHEHYCQLMAQVLSPLLSMVQQHSKPPCFTAIVLWCTEIVLCACNKNPDTAISFIGPATRVMQSTTSQTLFICALVFLTRRTGDLLLFEGHVLTNDTERQEFSTRLFGYRELTGLLEVAFNMMLYFPPEFMYYAEVYELAENLCRLLSRGSPEQVSRLFNHFFHQIQQEKLNVSGPLGYYAVYTQFIRFMHLFARIFIYRDAEIDIGIFINYFKTISKFLMFIADNYKVELSGDLELLAQCMVHLIAHQSSVDGYECVKDESRQLLFKLIEFSMENDSDHTHIVMCPIISLCDYFRVNDNAAEVFGYLYQLLMQLTTLRDIYNMRLYFIVRYCAGFMYYAGLCDPDALLGLILYRAINIDYVDCGPDCLYSCLYICLFNICEQSGIDYLQNEQLRYLFNYLPRHFNRIYYNRLGMMLRLQCYRYAVKFGLVEQLKPVAECVLVKYRDIGEYLLHDERLFSHYEDRHVDDELFDMKNQLNSMRYLSLEVQYAEPFY